MHEIFCGPPNYTYMQFMCSVFGREKGSSKNLVQWWQLSKHNLLCHFEHFTISTGLLFKQNKRSLVPIYHQLLYSSGIRNITGSAQTCVTSRLPLCLLVGVTLAKVTKFQQSQHQKATSRIQISRWSWFTTQVMETMWNLNRTNHIHTKPPQNKQTKNSAGQTSQKLINKALLLKQQQK